MSNFSFYGRKICLVKTAEGEKKIVKSGQWIGHSKYGGNEDGTDLQRAILLRNSSSCKILKVSRKIFWSIKGTSGEEIKLSDLSQKDIKDLLDEGFFDERDSKKIEKLEKKIAKLEERLEELQKYLCANFSQIEEDHKKNLYARQQEMRTALKTLNSNIQLFV